MQAVPYPFTMSPQYPGPAMSPAGAGVSQLMHGAAAPQMQAPAASSMTYGQRFAPTWQQGLPSQGPGAMRGTVQPRMGAQPRAGFAGTSPLPGVAPTAPAQAGGGMMSRMLGLGRTAGRAMGPLGAGIAAASMIPTAIDYMRGAQAAPPPPIDPYAPGLDMPPTSSMAPAQAPSPYMGAEDVAYLQQMMPAQAPAPMPARAPAPMPYPTGGDVREGMNAGIGDDTRARAMAWLLAQGR